MLSKVIVVFMAFMALSYAQDEVEPVDDSVETTDTVEDVPYIEPVESDFLRVDCPINCFKEQISDSEWQCVCPVNANETVEQSDFTHSNGTQCNSSIEVCGLVKIVPVQAGFKYNAGAFNMWGIMSAAMMSYSSFAANPYTFDTDVEAAFLYNLLWMFLTWGLQLFFWIQKLLFNSEGGAAHAWFIRMVNFGIVNFALIYWLLDMLIIRGILNYEVVGDETKTEYWAKLGVLFILQVTSTFIQINNKGSLEFDYKLATAEPTEYVPSDYEPGEVDFDELPQEDGEEPVEETEEGEEPEEVPADTTIDESDISAFWGF